MIPSQVIASSLSIDCNSMFFNAYNPGKKKIVLPMFFEASEKEIDKAVEAASSSFSAYRQIDGESKAVFLEKIAEEIEALGDELINKAHEETALPIQRLSGERLRTTSQLRLFAQLIKDNNWRNIVVDEALPDRQPIPRHEILQMQMPLGVVAVFGASNFPLAFSVAGGDTAAALASGCPVVFKAHPAHPGTCQLVAAAITKAIQQTGMPSGIFSMVHGASNKVGELLVKHPLIKAVAFTGSFKGGKALYDLAVRRPEPIPVYAEMGSVNPVFFLPGSLEKGGNELAKNFVGSVTLGAGQFCTNPGVFVLLKGKRTDKFIQQVAAYMSEATLHPLLTKNIEASYKKGLNNLHLLPGAEILAGELNGSVNTSLVKTSVKAVLKFPEYLEEVFGPSTVAVIADNESELLKFIEKMPGQLTATIHASADDYEQAKKLREELTYKVGRVVMNAFPTGVEVCNSMVHGGPYPATTDSRSTSVGTTSIYRFTRPVCFQNFPKQLLPAF